MKNAPSHPVSSHSLEEGVSTFLSSVQRLLLRRYREGQACVRRSPTQAVLGAVAVGYLMHRMPLRSILVTHVRVLSALTPPALLLFGAAKLYAFLQEQESAKRK